jgi:phenylalanine-4-hydroxylase
MEHCLSSYTIDELKAHGIATGKPVKLEFLSGVIVSGVLTAVIRRDQKNVVLSFKQCTVIGRDGELLFDPHWGIYDMAVGDAVVSVYGGSADQQAYPLYPAPSAQTTASAGYDDATQALFALYERVKGMRGNATNNDTAIIGLLQEIMTSATNEWLLLFEAVELAQQYGLARGDYAPLLARLKDLAAGKEEQRTCLINYGLARLNLR